MIFFSGLKKTMKKPQSRKTIIQPIGALYMLNLKKLISMPISSL